MGLKFLVEVKKGRIQWTNKVADSLYAYLSNLGDGTIEMIIQRPQKPGSDAQRSYYWGVMMKTVADDTGMSELEVHEFCKYKFLPLGRDSTETLTSSEREAYHNKIRIYFNTEFNILIPLPNEPYAG